jgi:hypothetical protein
MRGHFRYLRFKTFPMTPRTPQCKVFWALLLNSKHSRVPKDSKSPILGVLGFTPTLGQSGVATDFLHCINVPTWHGQQRVLEVLLLLLYIHFIGRGSQRVFRQFKPPLKNHHYLALSSCDSRKGLL